MIKASELERNTDYLRIHDDDVDLLLDTIDKHADKLDKDIMVFIDAFWYDYTRKSELVYDAHNDIFFTKNKCKEFVEEEQQSNEMISSSLAKLSSSGKFSDEELETIRGLVPQHSDYEDYYNDLLNDRFSGCDLAYKLNDQVLRFMLCMDIFTILDMREEYEQCRKLRDMCDDY